MNYDTHELAWAAGFFDGEGYTKYMRADRHQDPKRRTYRSITLEVPQKDPQLLERFQRAVGVGRIYGPYKNGKIGQNAVHYSYRFVVSSFSHVEFIGELLYPWLGEPKRKQLTDAIRGWALAPRFNSHGKIIQKRRNVEYP